jgi:hypothetical protein
MVSTILWILLLVALVAVPAVVGALRREAPRPDWLAIAGATLVGIVFGVLAATTHVDGVPLSGTLKGVAVACALGGVPAYLLYLLGRALGRRPVVLGLICLALTAPLGFVYFVGWIVVLDNAHCTPDAYECPF